MTADDIFKKMGKSNVERKELMHQMKLYRIRQKPFDIDLGASEFPATWWFSMEDNFPKGKDYLVQLALKLLSVTPHAAGCERVWSNLGWLYGKRRNRLGLNKIENMHKLSSYYHAHAKQELPYFSIGKSSEEIRDIIIDAHLNPSDDLIEIMDDTSYDTDNTEVADEEDNLVISEVLNLDAEEFIVSLDEIIEDSENMEAENTQNENESEESEESETEIDWDPATEADKIIDTM
jgi:hypothetical protein